MSRSVPLSVLLIVASALAASPQTPRAVDGLFDDWAGAAPVWTDPAGDGDDVDVCRVWARSDSERLTLRVEMSRRISLQSGNTVELVLDGDGDPSTGRAIEGVGAELVWRFGGRRGAAYAGSREESVEQAAVGLLQAPTVSSSEFEISFLRRGTGGAALIAGPTASMVLATGRGPGRDRVPDEGWMTLRLSAAPPPFSLAASLERRRPNDIRVLTWNVLSDGLFKRPAPFIRILKAIDPDVICFQEIWSHDAREAADQLSLALPGLRWHGASTTDALIVSRYPFIDARPIDDRGNSWALVDLPDDRYDVDLSAVSAHPPCCDNEEGRQSELDGIAAWLRDLVTPDGMNLSPGTPVVVAGDMNLVGGVEQLETLLAGRIADEGTFGASHPPDWDATPLADAMPRHAGGVDTYTWRDAGSSFAPGRLDYIVFSDSVLGLGNAFVLSTEELDQETLARHGLLRNDTLDASDHLPVVADFAPLAARVRKDAAE